MMKKKMFKNLLFTLIAILAVFCVSIRNVSAASRITGSFANPTDNTVSTENAGTVAPTSNIRLNGTSCSLFDVYGWRNYSKEIGQNKGPYIGNQGNIRFIVTGASDGCNGKQFVAFCLDPQYDGVMTGETKKYKAEQVRADSKFGRRIYALYTLWMKESNTDPQGASPEQYFKYNVAARFLAMLPDSDYKSRGGVTEGRWNSHARPYRELDCAGIGGSVACDGLTLANNAMTLAESDEIKNAQATTLGLSLSQGGAASTGKSNDMIINANIENCPDDACYNATVSLNASNGASVRPFGDSKGTYNKSTRTKTFSYIVSFGGSDCVNAEVEGTLNYKSPDGDIRNAMQLAPIDETSIDRQNYVVFINNPDSSVKSKLTINTCNPPETVGKYCDFEAKLACTDDNVNTVVVNEGDTGGGTDWNCIIHGQDKQGNNYDVVDTKNLKRDYEQGSGELAYQRTDDILGYTCNTSGGGGDGHSIDDSNFCTISCKEKYAFVLPGGKKDIQQGTYFAFHVTSPAGNAPLDNSNHRHPVVGVGAERACISSFSEGNGATSIHKDTFNNRVKDLRRQQLDFYNMYLYYKQLYNAMRTTIVTNAYKSNYKEPLWQLDPNDHFDSTGKYIVKSKFGRFKLEGDELVKSDTFKRYWWIDTWDNAKDKDGNVIKFTYKWYKLPASADQLTDTSLKVGDEYLELAGQQEIEINLSFMEAVAKYPKILQTNVDGCNNANMSFYEKYYSDIAEAWKYKMSVASMNPTMMKEEQSDRTDYYYWYYGKKYVDQGCMSAEDNPSEAECTKYGDEKEEHYKYVVKYAENSEKYYDDLFIKLDPLNGSEASNMIYKNYIKTMNEIKDLLRVFQEKYDALGAQIGVQSDAMQECTNYLSGFGVKDGVNETPYRFDPTVTFTYPKETLYNAELAPNILENMNSGEVTVNYEKYFCTSPATGADIFTNCKGAEPAQVTFGFGLSSENLEDPEPQMQDNTQDVAKYIPIYKVDVTKYYDVYNVGSRATYGRFKKDGSSCEGGFEFNNGTGGDYCYEFYQSAKQFFVQGPDGVISTTARADNNQTILSTDGRVYPVAITTPPGKYPFYVTFANIGQFNESGSLGRLMGGGDGKAGVMQGEYGDTQVCFYEVCKIDDPECGEYCTTDDGTKKSITQCLKTGKSRDECEKEAGCNTQCASIAKGTQCNNGNIADTLNFSEDKYFSCLNTLLDQQEDCCSYVDEYMVLRNNTTLKPGVYEKYMKKCDVVKECQSFTLISSDYFNDTANLTDLTSINNSGALQVNARAVSLYNLFSNSENEMGINWQGENKTITHIQEIGDGIFGDTDKYLQYHVVMDNDCAKEISSYNRQEAGGDYGNGGFNDYTGKITDANINEFDPNWKENGQDAAMSKEFYNILKDHCSLDGNAATGESPVAPENNNRWDDKEITVVDK